MQWCLAANRHTGSLEQRRERREEGTAHPHYQRTTKTSSLELAGPVTRARARAPTEGGRGSGQLAGGNEGKKGARRREKREGGHRSGQLSSLAAPAGCGGGGNGRSGGHRVADTCVARSGVSGRNGGTGSLSPVLLLEF